MITGKEKLGFSLAFENFSQIQNSDLDVIVQEELSAFPRTGETNVIAGLRQRGLFVQRWRVREVIMRVDPINRVNRWGQRIQWRPYGCAFMVVSMDSLGQLSTCRSTTTTGPPLFFRVFSTPLQSGEIHLE